MIPLDFLKFVKMNLLIKMFFRAFQLLLRDSEKEVLSAQFNRIFHGV